MPIMNGVNAIKTAKGIYDDFQFIFTTGHQEFAVEAFSMAAVDYILKPIEFDRIVSAVEKAKNHMVKIRYSENHIGNSHVDERLLVKFERSIHFVPIKDILFIEKIGRKSIIHTTENKIETYENLSTIQDRLPRNFIQTHRSYIVNFDKIAHIQTSGETYLVHFKGYNHHAFISRNKMQLVQEMLKGK